MFEAHLGKEVVWYCRKYEGGFLVGCCAMHVASVIEGRQNVFAAFSQIQH